MAKDKILIVDDEDDLREILSYNLQKEGYDTEAVPSGEAALLTLNANHRLILLDIMMGGIDGFKTAEAIRGNGIQTPIIFLTAKNTEDDRLKAFALGADDYISKPFSIKEIIARVNAVLNRSKTTVGAVKQAQSLHIGGIDVDLENKVVRIDDVEVAFTKTEFAILKLLMERPSTIFSREDILRSVWPNNTFVLERTVDVHINRIRTKLGSQSNLLVSRLGYGYCIKL